MYESKSEYLLFFINNLNSANVLLRILKNDIYGEENIELILNSRQRRK